MTRLLLAMLLALGGLLAKAGEPVVPADLPPDREASVLAAAEATGLSIYRHDLAAAVATDAALRVRAFKKDKRVRGWITEERDGGVIVTFIDGTPAALYRVTVSGAGDLVGEVEVLESPQPLTEFESGAAAARASAMASDFEPCSDRYNSVVLPARDGAEKAWKVYLLPATTRNGVVPAGGTYLIETDGQAIIARRAFTHTCIVLQNDHRAAALMITHLLDPTPTEAHVFWSLSAHKPLYVATPPNGTIWAIESGKIRRVERDSPEG